MTPARHVPDAIAAELGRPLPPGWEAGLAARLGATRWRGKRWPFPGRTRRCAPPRRSGSSLRVASNSAHRGDWRPNSPASGLAPLVAGRVLSAETVIARGGRGKPAPDLFLDAAASAGVAAEACLVIEDSPTGVQGAAAAGMACLGFSPHGDGAALLAAGAVLFDDLAALPALLRLGMQARGMTIRRAGPVLPVDQGVPCDLGDRLDGRDVLSAAALRVSLRGPPRLGGKRAVQGDGATAAAGRSSTRR